MSQPTAPVRGSTPQPLSYVALGLIVLGYLAVIKGGGMLVAALTDADEDIVSTEGVIYNMWIPLGAALVYTYAVVAVLGWWRPVLRDDRPTRKWVWAIPIIFAVCILAAIDYAHLADKPIGYVLALLVATQFVGWGEEGMFRGIGVTALRSHGLTEGKVALWSSVLFGAVHISNAITEGTQAIGQAVAVSFAGYFFYLIRRVSGGNVMNSIIHGLFDFSLISGTVILADQEPYLLGSLAGIAAYVLSITAIVVCRNRVNPAGPTRLPEQSDAQPTGA